MALGSNLSMTKKKKKKKKRKRERGREGESPENSSSFCDLQVLPDESQPATYCTDVSDCAAHSF
jgi:hypothetical protein